MAAHASGLPVVGTAVGGVLDAVRDGIEGRVVPPRRPDLLASVRLTPLDLKLLAEIEAEERARDEKA